MVALLAGVGGAVALAVAASGDARRALDDPLPAGVGLLLAAAALDVAGRLLCLGTPQASVRWLVVASVVCQLGAVPLVLGAAPASSGDEGRRGLLAGAALVQVAAAVTFTVYLFAVGVYFRSPPVMTLAALVKVAMAGAAGVLAVAAVVLVLLAVLFVIGVVLLFVCPCLGCTVMAWAAKLGEGAVRPLAIALAVVLGLVELAYAATLSAVLWELRRCACSPDDAPEDVRRRGTKRCQVLTSFCPFDAGPANEDPTPEGRLRRRRDGGWGCSEPCNERAITRS